jgi:hypothetical protein
MNQYPLSLVSCVVAGGFLAALGGAVLAETSTTPQSPMTSPSEVASDFDKRTEAGRLDPHSGTTVPDSSSESNRLSQPPGIGEKGSGQTQSTIERSGGQQSRGTQQEAEGKTRQAMKELQSREPDNR